MNLETLKALAGSLRDGDSTQRELWQRCEPHFVRIVRRHLRPGAAPSPLQERIHLVAKEVRGNRPFTSPDDSLEVRVARQLCVSLLDTRDEDSRYPLAEETIRA
jgi:hypothetical protein